MANKGWSGGYVPPATGLAPNLATIFDTFNDSIMGDTVPSFDNIAARDSSFGPLTTAQKRGALAHVAGRGWCGYDGSVWRDIAQGSFKWGVTDPAVVEGNGFARVNSGFCFFDGAPPSLMIPFSRMSARYQFSFRLYDGSGALFECWDSVSHAAVPSGNQVALGWLAIK